MEAYEKLEQEWAAFNWLDPAGMVACSSGTAALHLALEAMRLPLGSEVVTGDFNMVAVPRAIAMAGHVPVFVDCNSHLNMDPTLVEMGGLQRYEGSGRYVERAVRGILAVHVYGRRCDMRSLALLADHYTEIGQRATFHPKAGKVFLIEDLAEAHGTEPHGKTDAACWSFYRNKVVHGEEGGAVWFRDPKHAALARQLRSLGFTDAHDFWHVPRGHNYRMSNCHAELVLASLHNWDSTIRRRREIEGWYEEACPREWRMPTRESPWVYDLRLPWGAKLDVVVATLKAAGIQARHSFKPMSQQEEFVRPTAGEKAYMASRTVMYLPIQPGVTTRESCRKAFEVIESLVK